MVAASNDNDNDNNNNDNNNNNNNNNNDNNNNNNRYYVVSSCKFMNLTRSFGQVNTRFFGDMFISYLLMYTVLFCMSMQSINILYYTMLR